MAGYDYDLFVIGAGSGGVRAARLAAMSGARVAVAEEYRVGGTCVIRGCVPKKFMVYASEFTHAFEEARGFGWEIEGAKFDWRRFLMAKDAEISRLSGIYTSNLEKAGVDLLLGTARFVDDHTLELKEKSGGKRTITAAKVLIATGGRPTLPTDVPGIEHVITSEEAFHLPELPKRMVIVGGGYIAVEFACIFHGLGVDVTLIYRGPNILRGFDEDVRAHLADELKSRGLKVMVSCQHESIEKREDGVLVSHVGEGHTLESEVVMFATGRAPHVKGLGLEAAGVKLNDKGAVAVDAFSRTNVEHIWAVGDVTDRMALTPVAIREAQAFAETEFYGRPMSFDHADVPTAVFSQPPVGTVGLTEAQARHKLGPVDVYLTRFRPMKTTFYGGRDRFLMKLIVCRENGKVVGCHIVGPDSAEMIQLAAIAVKAGLTKAQWDATCALHPSAAEELVTLREKYVPMELAAAQ
ncbi:glutathione-disulfide reductase [Phenylobacterium montanum]|uniref:Glutathione reductase n=1 Tax=Phenylobacterium montanum TaxID=2823693 RepID=A0A975IV13_9CAUL|nr:glutathione-disulfide reductase [Caulobacter sp. S6]QUD88368.1 glutathione-disulfide reductase [Caulobacter sp. S6]